ncbi:hypothetical protein PR048_025312 [Dryococelus australis]|uniref:Uncharacterized protein n=1 Tax=Dryococelus australis TaxID=614101 RepID=A0ABQ9GR35_9NEOP|nr:hypothetical protein PR048_025312 [Dryococelus australis]
MIQASQTTGRMSVLSSTPTREEVPESRKDDDVPPTVIRLQISLRHHARRGISVHVADKSALGVAENGGGVDRTAQRPETLLDFACQEAGRLRRGRLLDQNEDGFNHLWSEMDSKVVEYDLISPTLPRSKKTPRRLQQSNYALPDYQFASPEELYRKVYFEALRHRFKEFFDNVSIVIAAAIFSSAIQLKMAAATTAETSKKNYLTWFKPRKQSEMSIERHWSGRAGKRGALREGPQARGIVRHDSRVREYGRDPTGNRARFPLVGGE